MVSTLPVATTFTSTVPVIETVAFMNAGVVGPNTHGVPENFPLIPADAGCHKCHGTGYKKKMLSHKYKACKKCSKKYGTDVHRLNLDHIDTHYHHN